MTEETVSAMLSESAGCFGLYRVTWIESLLSLDGHHMFCWFSAPDAESARGALRAAGERKTPSWQATIHDSPVAGSPHANDANVVVSRRFAEPTTLEEIQAIEDAGAWCLEAHDTTFARTYFSQDRTRMVCLYRAPDAESVRTAQRKASMPVESVWSFRRLTP